MVSFAKGKTQAGKLIKEIQGKDGLESVGTVSNFEQRLTVAADFIREHRHDKSLDLPRDLRSMTKEQAAAYLHYRSETSVDGKFTSQSTLNMDRQALEAMLRHTGELDKTSSLPIVRTEAATMSQSRHYTDTQVTKVLSHQTSHNALASEIAYRCGLRAHELLTLRPLAEQPPDQRPTKTISEHKFAGRSGVSYTAIGKGGLCREIKIPEPLADRLASLRLDTPRFVNDRGIPYHSHYAIAGGNAFSSSFTRASQRAVGWSAGAHGLRHTYAQQRMVELQEHGLDRDEALLAVSQELGHFRPDITLVYLR